MSELFDPLFGRTAVVAATGDRAWLSALCEAEAALARACARAGLLPEATAQAVAAACDVVAESDPAVIGVDALAGGNPVLPLVALLRETVRPDARSAVHLGATSQDILDTAMMLLAQRATTIVLADLDACAAAAVMLARTHRDTVMAARTLLQQAMPTTFGALAVGWAAGLDRARRRLRSVRDALPAQLGGAAGTLAGWHPAGPHVQALFAEQLGLAEPHTVWHAERGVVVELAGALGQVAAAVAKPAGDIVLLAQSEVGEVHEQAPGGSSAMAHKQNPIAAVTARAGALQAPGLVATLHTCGAPELQRGAGAWHAEWPALTGLLRAVGGAAVRLRDSLTGLQVDVAAMRRNLAGLEGSVDTADVGHAADLVDRYLERRAQ